MYINAHVHCEKRFDLKKDDRVEQCIRSCGSEFQMWGPKKEKVRNPLGLAFVLLVFSTRMSEEERSVLDGV